MCRFRSFALFCLGYSLFSLSLFSLSLTHYLFLSSYTLFVLHQLLQHHRLIVQDPAIDIPISPSTDPPLLDDVTQDRYLWERVEGEERREEKIGIE